jgi:hypothetical protein
VTERVSFSPKEYAERHGVSTRTVHRWIKSGRVHVIRFTARTIRVVPKQMLTDDDTRGHARGGGPMTDPLFSVDAIRATLLLALGIAAYGIWIWALVAGAGIERD